MTEPIGELLLQNGMPLLKMWVTTVLPGDRPFVRHSHTRFEIMAVNSGSGEYTTENEVYPMQPGDVFVFSSNEVHCITRAGEDGLSITNLHFEPRYLAGGEEGDSFIPFCFSHSPSFENRIPAERADELRRNLLRIRGELLQGSAEYAVAVKAHLYLILIALLRHHAYRSPTEAQTRNRLSGILAGYDYIDRHLCEPLRLEDIAGAAGLSPNYFSHIFRRLNGISLWDYITARRIERAAKLLGEGDRTILEVALLSGFNNTVHFNKTFRRHKGMTPTQYRRSRDTLMH